MTSSPVQPQHTIIVSDIHLADAEPPHPDNPLWKRFKRPKYFVDRNIKRFLEYLITNVSGSMELILNGDIFDFDSIMQVPDHPTFHVSWLEHLRGLESAEKKSQYKMNLILRDHQVFFEALQEFIKKGHSVVFIIGNHDMEVHWPSVQAEILSRLELTDAEKNRFRFCEWFYISNRDTLIEHGNQYDSFCIAQNPIHPLIQTGSEPHVRIPFGNLAGRYMTNGMGLFNTHVESSYIKTTFAEYFVFFYKYVVRVQPFLIWTWFWGALVTLFYSIREGLAPALRDPLTVEQRIDDIAERSNATPRIARSLRALHVHAAIFNPVKILKELWLDRALLLLMMILFSFWFFSVSNLITNASFLGWFVIPFLLLLPFFIFYARSVESEYMKVQKVIYKKVPLSAQIVGVKRVIHGHTHHEMHRMVRDIEYINTGTWSPAFHDVECMKPYGKKCFAWIQASMDGSPRSAKLCEWLDPGFQIFEKEEYKE